MIRVQGLKAPCSGPNKPVLAVSSVIRLGWKIKSEPVASLYSDTTAALKLVNSGDSKYFVP